MDQSIKRLLTKDESRFHDFKIICQAFSKDASANAELAKDIIAFANNGAYKSYIIIGVSDDRCSFRSVENTALIGSKGNDNLQRLCHEYIYPMPNIVKKDEIYKCIDGKEVKLVIIEIGPNPNICFRFAKDIIDYGKKICFKKNEVWLRHEATSDLASPEEIARILGRKIKAKDEELNQGTDYERVYENDYRKCISNDLKPLIDIVSYEKMYPEVIAGFRIQLSGRIAYLRLHIMNETKKKASVFDRQLYLAYMYSGTGTIIDQLHHGYLVISKSSAPRIALEGFDLKIQLGKWGWFCVKEDMRFYVNQEGFELPKKEYQKKPIFCVVLCNVTNTQVLFNRWNDMLHTIESDGQIIEQINRIINITNKQIKTWTEFDCCERSDKHYFGNKPQLKDKTVFIDEKNFGAVIMKKNRSMVIKINKFMKTIDPLLFT
jgi:hypothetical protein